MRWFRGLLLFVCLLTVPGGAQQQNPYLQFISQVIAKAQANDFNGATALIQGNPQVAAQTFDMMFFAYPQAVDPTLKQTAKIYCNLVARIFEEGGNPALVGRLRDAGMLVEIATPDPPPPATGGSVKQAGMDLFQLYMLAIRSTLRCGNFLAANRQARAYREWNEDIAKLGFTDGLEFSRTLEPAVDLTAMDAVGVHHGAEEMGKLLIQRLGKVNLPGAGGNPALYVRGSLVAAGRDGALPALVDANLAEGLKIQGKEDDDVAIRFALLGFQAERELEKDPEMPLEALLARHEAAWSTVRGKTFSNLYYGGVGRWFSEAARFWMDELARRESHQVPGSATANRLAALRAQDEQALAALAEAALQPSQLGRNPEFLTGLLDHRLDRVEALRLAGELTESRRLLTQAASDAARLQSVVAELDREYNDHVARETGRLKAQLGGAPGVRLGLDSLPAPLTAGEALRLGARTEFMWVRQELAENPGKLPADKFEKVRGHLGRGQEMQEKARGGLGARGLDQTGLTILAVLFQQRGEKWQEHAQTMLTDQLALARALNERPGLIAALTYEGELKVAAGNPAGAMQSLTEAVDLAEGYIREAGAGEKGAGRIRERYRRAYELLVQLLLEAGRNAEAFSVLGRMQQMDSIAWAAPQLNRRDLAGLNRLRGEAAALEQEVVAVRESKGDARPAETLLAGKKAEYQRALEGVKQANPELESLIAVHPVSLAQVQQALPADTVLVQYFPAPDALYIFVADKKELKIRKLAVKADDLRTLVREARAGIIQAGRQGGGTSPPALGSLHKVLIDPVEADLPAMVVFIPTGFLDYVPFAALSDASGKFLIERKRCATILKSSEIEQITRARAKDGKLVALGNPDGSLPAAGEEVTQIGQMFPGSSTKVGAGVGKADVQVAPGTGVLHLATHGVIDNKNPAGSYLVLGGNQNLMMADIYGLKLKGMRLVTLSACDTAVGEREPGRNLTTLADAFGVAGSPTVIASLWKVSDRSTRELMVGFYKGVKEGKSLAEAMQQAQKALVARPEFRSPFYWAPFVLLGDWR